MSVKFVSAILGPEIAAPILWTPGKIAFFLQENRYVRKIPRFRGGGYFRLGGERSADFIVMGAGIFLNLALTQILSKFNGYLVATLHFSPFTCCFRRLFKRSFTVSFRNENAEFTQSLLCSLFAI